MRAVNDLIPLLERDILERGLRPGDRYISTREVARMLGVSTKTANQALQQLAARGLLVRRRRSGTYIGTTGREDDGPRPTHLHLIMRGDVSIYAKPFINEFLEGMQREFPHDALQMTFIPPDDEARFVRRQIDTLRAGGLLDGAVLFLSSPMVQRYFADSGLPTVVAGSVYPEASGLCWVDIDQRGIGRLLAERIVARGHDRITLLMHDQWAYDDNLLVEGVQEALDARGLRHNALNLRTVHAHADVIRDTVRGQLAGRDGPVALLCRSARILRCALQVVEEMGLRVPEDVLLTVADCLLTRDGTPPEGFPKCPYMKTSIDGVEHGALVARMLKEVMRGRRPHPDHHVIPVAIEDPLQTARKGR